MVTRTFLDKCNSIFKGHDENFGLNPICMLNYGSVVSRFMVHFPIEDIMKMKNSVNGEVRHYLVMTNCGSIEPEKFDDMVLFNARNDEDKFRASSFDVICFKIPYDWDAGNGFDNTSDFWLHGKAAISFSGSTWKKNKNGHTWRPENIDGETLSAFEITTSNGEKIVPDEGIFSQESLLLELKEFEEGNSSIIVGRQKFDRGNENLKIDITNYVNEILESEDPDKKNCGLCLSFSPEVECICQGHTSYVGFFSNTTNTFYKPYIESRCDKVSVDNRYSVSKNRNNRIYFFAYRNGCPIDLGESINVSFEGAQIEEKRAILDYAGAYYVDLSANEVRGIENDTIVYDTWSGMVCDGVEIDPVEMKFIVTEDNEPMRFGERELKSNFYTPTLSGINDNENIYKGKEGEERTVRVIFMKNYSQDEYLLSESAKYRLYVKDGKREIDVIDWDGINVEGKFNYFRIKTKELIPQVYHVDVMATIEGDRRIFKDVLTFKVVDNVTELKK